MDVCEPVLALAAADSDLLRPMLAIGFVLGLLFLLLFLVRRLGAQGAPKLAALNWRAISPSFLRRRPPERATDDFVILGQLTLTPTHRLHVVSLRGHDVAVVTHPQGCEWFGLENLETARFSGALEDARAAAMRSGR